MKPDLCLPAYLISRPCIYGWWRNRRYLYIGKSARLLHRIGTHHIIGKKLELEPDDRIDVWFCSTSELNKFEAKLIKEFNPPLNKLIPTASGRVLREWAEIASTKVERRTEKQRQSLQEIQAKYPEFNVTEFVYRWGQKH